MTEESGDRERLPAIVNSKILGAETLDASFRSSSIEGVDRLKRPKLVLNLCLLGSPKGSISPWPNAEEWAKADRPKPLGSWYNPQQPP